MNKMVSLRYASNALRECVHCKLLSNSHLIQIWIYILDFRSSDFRFLNILPSYHFHMDKIKFPSDMHHIMEAKCVANKFSLWFTQQFSLDLNLHFWLDIILDFLTFSLKNSLWIKSGFPQICITFIEAKCIVNMFSCF